MRWMRRKKKKRVREMTKNPESDEAEDNDNSDDDVRSVLKSESISAVDKQPDVTGWN